MKLSQPYNPSDEHFEVLINKYQEAQTFASDAGEPIAEIDLINNSFVLLEQSGVLD